VFSGLYRLFSVYRLFSLPEYGYSGVVEP